MRNYLRIFILLLMFGLLVFFNSLNNKFLIDDYTFLGNPVLSSSKFILSQWNPYREQVLGVVDGQADLIYYRPLAHMVYDICYSSFKSNYWQYHLLNLFLFVLAASLIFVLIDKIFKSEDLALLVSLFYLIHPINGIIVNYISASVFAFQLICMLASILFLLESLERNNHRGFYALSLVFSFLALFWHESGIMTPFYISTVVLLFGKDIFRKKIAYLFPYFLIIFSYLVFRSLFLVVDKVMFNQIMFFNKTGLLYLGAFFQILMWYISRLFYPQGIVMIWAAPIMQQNVFCNLIGLCGLLLICVLLFVKFNRDKIVQLALVWILIGFSPVYLGAFRNPDLGALIEPHWFIFSSIGFFILSAYVCLMLLKYSRIVGVVVLFILVFVWGGISNANNKLWFDQRVYSLYWAQHAPDLKTVDIYIAEYYEQEGNLKEAYKYFKKRLKDLPYDTNTYSDFGRIDLHEGNWKGAEANFEMALKYNPNSADTNNNLGDAYLHDGQEKKAKECFFRSLSLNPVSPFARLNLAVIFLRNNQYQKAIELCLKNLEINNNDSDTLFQLIDIFNKQKDLVNMKKIAYRLLNNKTDPEILTNLGIKMGQDGFPDIAIDSYTKALRLAPNFKEAYLNTGKLFANLGKYDEAIYLWKLGSGLDSSDRNFKLEIIKAEKLKSKK